MLQIAKAHIMIIFCYICCFSTVKYALNMCLTFAYLSSIIFDSEINEIKYNCINSYITNYLHLVVSCSFKWHTCVTIAILKLSFVLLVHEVVGLV